MGRGRSRKRRTDEDDDNGFAAWGGYMAAKKSKLLDQYSEAAESETNKLSDIFKGVSIFVNGYTTPSAEELKNLMALHGGVYHHYHIPAKTTHIIASNLPDTKIKQLGWNKKIVKPEWIVESVKANKLLNYSNYLLYTNQNRLQPTLNFKRLQDTLKGNSGVNNEKNLNDTNNINNINYVTNNNNKTNNVINNVTNNVGNKTNVKQCYNERYDEVNDVIVVNDETNEEVKNEANIVADNKTSNVTVNRMVDDENKAVLYEPSSPDMFDDDTNSKSSGSVETTSKNVPGKGLDTVRTLNATDPRFLSEFYNNSRLHHISTMGAMFKDRVSLLREKSSFEFREREKFRQYVQYSSIKYSDDDNDFSLETPIIMHIDMDCFFVSVGLRNRPELMGHPVAVTHSRGGQEPTPRAGVDRQAEIQLYKQKIQDRLKKTRVDSVLNKPVIENQSMSEIASCSYEARKAGVKNGMFMGAALKLCPDLKTIPYDFEGYKEVANTLYDTIAEYTLDIEAVSCDEMFVDVSEILKDSGGTVEQWATYVRELIQRRTRCPCSTGFGANKLQARMATKRAKPNGQYYLQTNNIEEHMSGIRVDDLPGVGYSTTLKLNSMGVKTCGELQLIGLMKLQQEFGNKIGKTLYQHCRGIDDRPLVYKQERKSVSSEVNYGIRFKDNVEAETFIRQLIEEVHTRLAQTRMKGKCITFKLLVRSKDAPVESSKFMGHGVCDCVTKSTTLSTATTDLNVISREIFLIYKKLNIPPTELRGIGIHISRLEKFEKPVKNALTTFLKPKVSTDLVYKPLSITIPKLKLTSPEEENDEENDPEIDFDDFSHYVSTGETCSQEVKQKLKSIILSRNVKNKPDIETTSKLTDTDDIKNTETSVPICVVKPLMRSGKGRVRPKGSVNKPKITNMNIYSFLKPQNKSESIQSESIQPESNKPQTVQTEKIDLKFLSELPEDIRQELIREYNLQNIPEVSEQPPRSQTDEASNTRSTQTTESLIPSGLTKTPRKVAQLSPNNHLEKHIENLFNSSDSLRIFMQLSYKQIKQLIKIWANTHEKILDDDIELLKSYFSQLAHQNKIEDLFMFFKFMYNEILKANNCNWHVGYSEIVEVVQNIISMKYGGTLWVYKDFHCDKECGSK